jgi:hypothetical protein
MITRRAELLLVAASAAYADGDYAGAERRASATVQAFGRQGRAWWREHAVLLRLQARFHVDRPSARLLSAAAAVAARLHALASPDAIQADLLTGRIAIALGRPGAARAPLDRAARFRRSGSVATRVSGWLARALLASAEGRDAAMTAACRQGLNLLDEYQLTLGATELRARVTSQGGELAELLQRSALRSGRPRQLLLGSERWRATACAIPPVRPPDDSAALVDLVALRDVTTRLDKARRDNEPLGVLHRERSRLERQVRDRALRTSGTSSGPRIAPVDVGELLDRIGDARLLELVEIDGDLHVLVCGSGRVRRVSAGRAAVAADAVDQAGWLLRSIAHSGPSRSTDVVSPPVGRGPGLDGPRRTAAVRGRLNRVGAVLEAELLGAAVDDLGDGAVVVVPPGRLQGTPWALLPSLAGRAHSVAPSARAWLTALATPRPEHRTVLVRGPGLSTGGAEIDVIAPHHPGALILGGADATTAAVIEALESSSLAHVAAHGTFRADSPSFSSLRMHDGPLTVYDLERLRRGPHRLVLPSCDSARLQPVGADEMLGLATALLPLGTAALVAGVVPVHDAATVPIMAALHEALARGATMAEALLHARLTAPDDQLHWATARSFVAFGAA